MREGQLLVTPTTRSLRLAHAVDGRAGRRRRSVRDAGGRAGAAGSLLPRPTLPLWPSTRRRRFSVGEWPWAEERGTAVPGQHIMRGPQRAATELIGTNKSDAAEKVASLVADAAVLRAPERPDEPGWPSS